jgi:hypothetical protein
MTETSVETPDGKPLAFESVQDLGMMMMKVSGTVNKEGTAEVTVALMGAEQKSTFEWTSGALMAEGLRLMQIKKGLKEGSEYTVKVFSPGMMQAVEARVRVGAKRNVDLLGRIVALTEVVTTLTVPGAGEIVSTSYVDEELRAQKTVMPVAGMQVEMVACAKEFALGENDVLEVFRKMFLSSPAQLDNLRSVDSITYQLRPTREAGSLTIPSNDNQSVRVGKNGKVTVTVRPVAAPAGARFPYKGRDKRILEAMRPTRFLQSGRKEIIELAREAVGSTKDAGEAVKRIEAFVARYIEDKSLSVGYASAAEVASSRQGDCSEFSVLMTAMCRAAGIPARMVVGIAYVKEYAGFEAGFGGHAWVQAYVGGKWVGFDSTFKSAGRGGYGAGHIALAVGDGDPEDFFNLLNTMGQFEIEKVMVRKGR